MAMSPISSRPSSPRGNKGVQEPQLREQQRSHDDSILPTSRRPGSTRPGDQIRTPRQRSPIFGSSRQENTASQDPAVRIGDPQARLATRPENDSKVPSPRDDHPPW